VGAARLTCGQAVSKLASFQVRAKREDLSQVIDSFSKLLLALFVAFVDRVMETLERSECTGCPLLKTTGHFL